MNFRPSTIIHSMKRSIIWFRSTHSATDDWATRFCHLLSFVLHFMFANFFIISIIFFLVSTIRENMKCSISWLGMWICQIYISGSWQWMQRWSYKWMARKHGFSTPRYFNNISTFFFYNVKKIIKVKWFFCILSATSNFTY